MRRLILNIVTRGMVKLAVHAGDSSVAGFGMGMELDRVTRVMGD